MSGHYRHVFVDIERMLALPIRLENVSTTNQIGECLVITFIFRISHMNIK